MARTKKQSPRGNRQPVKYRLPVCAFNQKTAARPGGRRSKNYSVTIFNKTALDFSLRQFRTNKARRSKRNPQIVITIPFLAIREIAITKRIVHRRISQSKASTWQRSLKPAAAIPIVVGLIGATYFSMHINEQAKINITPRGHVLAARTAANTKNLPASAPIRLRIDKIGVSAPIIGLGLQTDGSLDTPPGPDVVGWYDKSPTPGQIGPAVIDGHVDWINNIAVFWRLRELVPGDTLAVDRADGTTATFKVTAIQEFPQDNFPTQAVYGNLDYAGIRLITCGGEFNSSTGHYSQNIVVFGQLI